MAEMTEREKMVEVMARAMAEYNEPGKWAESADEFGHHDYWRSAYLKEAIIIWDALTTAGYAIVPVEPTEGMIGAYMQRYPMADIPYGQVADDYRAMIAAWKKECGE